MPQSEFIYPEDHITDKSVRFICGELIREQLVLNLHEELPYTTAVEIEVFEDGTKVVTTINEWSDIAPEETNNEDYTEEGELGEELEIIIDEILANQSQSLSTRSITTFSNNDETQTTNEASQSNTAAFKLTDKYYAK